MGALATQNLLQNNGIDFFQSFRPGSSPDLNPCEHLGVILKQRVENRIINGGDSLQVVLNEKLETLKYDKETVGFISFAFIRCQKKLMVDTLTIKLHYISYMILWIYKGRK